MGLLCFEIWHRNVKLEYKHLKEKVRENNRKDAKFYGNGPAKMSLHGRATVATTCTSLPSIVFLCGSDGSYMQ